MDHEPGRDFCKYGSANSDFYFLTVVILILFQLFKLHTEGDNQLHQLRSDVTVTPDDLLSMPAVSQ